MEDVLKQLGGLLLNAVPTVLLFILLFVAYRVIVHRRLEQVLEERKARTEGAQVKAKADIAAAEAKAAEYEQRIRDAKVAIYKAQEARRRQLLEERGKIIAAARAAADQQVKGARAAIEQDAAAARHGLEQQAETLAGEVIRTILRPVTVPAVGGQS